MGSNLTIGSWLLFLSLFLICSGSNHENCIDYEVQFERVFAVPGETVMLNSTLVAPDVFNFTSTPYNISWYDLKTTKELHNETGRTLVWGHTLWFLNVKMEDAGEYATIVRTPRGCFRQVIKMVVEQPTAGNCERPQKAHQTLTSGETASLSCPLKDYIKILDQYNISSTITWFRGCDFIKDGADRHSYWNRFKLKIDGVEPIDDGSYTCTLSFSLGGVDRSVSETIEAWVKEEYSLAPQVSEPAEEIHKASLGSNFTKKCLVFVPSVGKPIVNLYWLARNGYILSLEPSDRVYTSAQRDWNQESPIKGVWFEKYLLFGELREEDFNTNYTCQAYGPGDFSENHFTLLPKDPSILVPIGSLMAAVTLLFINTVVFYYIFRIDIVLWFRQSFPIVYGNTDSDGKLYDAYVAYPHPGTAGFRQEVETFAVDTLTQVLEKSYGYKLFISGRDCLPGYAVADSVDENIRASRRLLLLYDSSTFPGNHNISKSGHDVGDCLEEDGVKSDRRQQLECVLAMHRALMECSLKVVLLELEEIPAPQLALLPESIRHLRKKQGAVCLWKTRKTRHRWRMCARSQDEEKVRQDSETPLSLFPSPRFWKEIRYHMPVRSKRAVSPEKTGLLKL